MGVPFSRPIFLLMGDLYPGYQTFKALESHNNNNNNNSSNDEARQQWLAFWVVRGCLRGAEWCVGSTAQSVIPMYTWFKLMFFAWLVHPQYRGALQCYASLVRPYLLRHEQDIDTASTKVTTEVTTRVRRASKSALDWLNVKKKEVSNQLVNEIKKAAVESIKENTSNVEKDIKENTSNNVENITFR